MTTLPPIVRLGPVVQLSPEAAWRLWQLATHGAASMTKRDGVVPSSFTRNLLGALADSARHRDADCRCTRQSDRSEDGPQALSSSVEVVSTTEAAGVLGLSPRSVQRKRHEIGGFRRTSSGRLEFDRGAVETFARMQARRREELDA